MKRFFGYAFCATFFIAAIRGTTMLLDAYGVENVLLRIVPIGIIVFLGMKFLGQFMKSVFGTETHKDMHAPAYAGVLPFLISVVILAIPAVGFGYVLKWLSLDGLIFHSLFMGVFAASAGLIMEKLGWGIFKKV